MAFLKNDDISINTLIGQNSGVLGDVNVSGFVRVDGDVDGNLVTTGNVILGEKARIKGNITAQSAIIGGVVLGNICAPDKIQLLTTATVIGDLVTHRIEIAENVVFQGHCIAVNNDEKYTRAVSSSAAAPPPKPAVVNTVATATADEKPAALKAPMPEKIPTAQSVVSKK
ncbi:MAG: hypothetical protein Ta2A_21380 [Treponemataceae bacterium]|nr:MAG: hypothetical protein Ta2A_21380 [Treponemataceae bacterium]